MSKSIRKRNCKQAKKEVKQKILVGSSIVSLPGLSFSSCKSRELDLTSLSSKQIRKKIGWL